MDARNDDFRGKPTPAGEDAETRHFTRRIDCAPTPAPRRPDPMQAPSGHGYGRAPGENA